MIIADEPTGNLDPETAEGIMQLLTGINRDRGTAVVMVTHNRALVEKYPGRIFLCANEECHEQKDMGGTQQTNEGTQPADGGTGPDAAEEHTDEPENMEQE